MDTISPIRWSWSSTCFWTAGDVDINTSDTSTPTHNQISGPITRARACQLNNQERRTGMKWGCIRAGGIRIPEQQQIVTAAPTTYGLGFRRENTFWKAPRVYFHMHQTSSPYHVGVGHNHYFGAETFFCQRCCDILFWPIGPCIMLSPIRTHPRVRARPNLPEVVLPHL
jgi:hypothetical protein